MVSGGGCRIGTCNTVEPHAPFSPRRRGGTDLSPGRRQSHRVRAEGPGPKVPTRSHALDVVTEPPVRESARTPHGSRPGLWPDHLGSTGGTSDEPDSGLPGRTLRGSVGTLGRAVSRRPVVASCRERDPHLLSGSRRAGDTAAYPSGDPPRYGRGDAAGV